MHPLPARDRATAAAGSPLPSSESAAPKHSSPDLISGALVLLIAVNAVCLLTYIFYTYQFHFHSDSAAANLLAQEIYETGQYFPRDWNWVNGDIWSLFMQTWVLVLLPFFENGFALHAAGSLLGCIITGLATWGVCSILGMSKRGKLFGVALISAGFTASMCEHMFGQQAYGTIYYIACGILIAAWNFIHGGGRQRLGWGVFAAFLILVAAWANPQRALIYYVLPMVAAMAAFYNVARTNPATLAGYQRNMLQLLAIAIIASLIGMVMYQRTMNASLSLGAKIVVNWLEFPAMADNVVRVLHGLIGLLAGTPQPGTPIATSASVLQALRFVGALAVVFTAPVALFRCMRATHPGHAFVAGAAAASIGTSLFIYVTTTLAIEGGAEQSVRYLVPGVVWVLLVLSAYVGFYKDAGPMKRLAGAAGLLTLALSAPLAYDVVKLPAHIAAGGPERENPNVRLARFLEAQNLQYGYASFWNASQLTVLSNSKSKVRQIQFDDSMPVPMRHLSSNRWYEPEAWKGPTFLLLTHAEVAGVDLDALFEATGKPLRRINFEGVHLIVFDHNIAADFPNWSGRVKGTLNYRVTARTPHAVGRYDETTRSIIGEKGVEGALRFGPYQRLAAGHYLVSFNLHIEGDGQADYGKVDVVAESGQKILGSRLIQATGPQRITVPVSFDEVASAVEFRVFTSGAGKVSVFNVELTNDDRNK